jgi:amino acid adenylation domain-containing protein
MSVNADTLHGLFRNSAQRFAGHIAIQTPGGFTLTYSQLLKDTEAAAEKLRKAGLTPGNRVLLLADKNPTALILILAILECGGCVVPVDADAPANRIAFLEEDLKPQLVLVAADKANDELKDYPKISIGTSGYFHFKKGDADNHDYNLAYILYTSGSTGIPKGVCLTHDNIIAFLYWVDETFKFSSQEKFSCIAPFYFDLSLLDIYGAFMCGGSIVLYSAAEAGNIKLLAETLAAQKVTNIYATPSTLRLMLQFGRIERLNFTSVRRVLFAGEIFPPQPLHQLMDELPGADFYNLYGPTETNVCNWQKIERPFDKTRQQPYPVGQVCGGLDARLDAETGELQISGFQVAQGYWNRPELTAASFLNDNGTIWYRTGDKMRSENGVYTYEGRIDRMIKKRGYRIEPGEVETALMQHPNVADAAVVGVNDRDGYGVLVACAVLKDADEPDAMLKLKTYLAAHLLSYMVPERIVIMRRLPKTGSGKTDYINLQEQL